MQPPPQADSLTPIHLHCSAALSESFAPSDEMDRAKAVMQSSPRMPAVGFFGGRYGDQWYVDIVSLSHNAVRRQLFDAFTIANALGKMSLDVAESDLARVYAWLGTLQSFVQAVLKAEDRLLYPLVDNNVKKTKTKEGAPVYLPELLSVRGRREARATIMDLLETARKTRDVATGETAAKIVALRYALDQFGANVLDYFSVMEKFVPKLLKGTLRKGHKDKDKLEKKLFDMLLSESHGSILAALLLQCIESRSRRAEFVNKCIRKERDRAAFRSHVKRVEGTHMQLARCFDDISTKYERRFNVNTFLERYEEHAHEQAQMTLAMLGDVDLNDEGSANASSSADVTHSGVNQVETEEHGDGLDDDVLEVFTEVGPSQQ